MKYIDNRLNAKIVKLEDANNNFVNDNVEDALNEIDSKIKNIETDGYDDTQLRQSINNIKTELGTVGLVTTNQTIKGGINEVNSRIDTLNSRVDNIANNSGGSSGGSIDTSSFATKTELNTNLSQKQDKLVSGTNIKTINGQSLLGNGNIAITSSGGSSGGSSSNISITVNDANYTATNNIITLPNYLTIPKDKKITIIGDSITYGFDGTDASLVAKPYPWIIQDLLGVPVYNYGISGSTITGGGASTSIPGNSPMNIRYTDMVYADYALVLGGVNDYAIISAPLGKKGDTTNQTFYGALRILIEGLITKYPTGKIGFMTPLRKANDTAANVAGFTLKQYRDAIIDMCEDYCIPVLDLYTKGGCHPNIGAWRNANLPDGLHPNQAYYRKLALQIAQFIQSI